MVAWIIGYDWWAIHYGHETLSGAFWRHCQRHPNRVAITLIATLVYKHLVAPGVLPQADPLRVLADRWHEHSKTQPPLAPALDNH